MISGTTFAHKAIEHDYCLRHCVESMLPVCDEVILLDCGGDDGTSELIKALGMQHPKIRIFRVDWRPDHAAGKWLADLVNYARSKAAGDYHFHLQADEVLGEGSHDEFLQLATEKTPFFSHRYNFWVDPWHLIPHGRVCGHMVLRCAPMECPSKGDAEQLDVEQAFASTVELFHYGFLRKPGALRKKAIHMEEHIIGHHNPVWDAEDTFGELRKCYPEDHCLKFSGNHPARMIPWLKERGYEPVA